MDRMPDPAGPVEHSQGGRSAMSAEGPQDQTTDRKKFSGSEGE